MAPPNSEGWESGTTPRVYEFMNQTDGGGWAVYAASYSSCHHLLLTLKIIRSPQLCKKWAALSTTHLKHTWEGKGGEGQDRTAAAERLPRWPQSVHKVFLRASWWEMGIPKTDRSCHHWWMSFSLGFLKPHLNHSSKADDLWGKMLKSIELEAILHPLNLLIFWMKSVPVFESLQNEATP